MKRWIVIAGVLVVLTSINVFYLLNVPTLYTVHAPTIAPELRDSSTTVNPESTDPEIILVAVGDIMLSRNVAATIAKQQDPMYPFLYTREVIDSADIAFANLESPITPGPEVKTGSYTFHANPGIEKSLAWAGFNVVSLANNHMPNYGDQGISDTMSLLHSVGISYAGVGMNSEQATAPAVLEIKGKKFGFLAYNDSDVVPPRYGAGEDRPGTNLMDTERLVADLKSLRPQVDYIIVSMHSGTEYTAIPNERQRTFAHAAIDNGADLVIGHHPHVVQSIEKYNTKYIFYSLGNFVFDQMFSEETRQGLMARIIFGPTGVSDIFLIPTYIENYSQPHFLDPLQALDTQRRFLIPVTTTTRDNIGGWQIDK